MCQYIHRLMNFLCTTNVSQHWHVVEIDLSRIILCMLHQTMKTFSSPNSNTMLEPIAFCTIRSIWHSSHSLWWEISICAQARKLVSYAYFAFNKFVSLILHFHTIFRLWSHLSLVSTLCQSNQIPTYFSFRQLCIFCLEQVCESKFHILTQSPIYNHFWV